MKIKDSLHGEDKIPLESKPDLIFFSSVITYLILLPIHK